MMQPNIHSTKEQIATVHCRWNRLYNSHNIFNALSTEEDTISDSIGRSVRANVEFAEKLILKNKSMKWQKLASDSREGVQTAL